MCLWISLSDDYVVKPKPQSISSRENDFKLVRKTCERYSRRW